MGLPEKVNHFFRKKSSFQCFSRCSHCFFTECSQIFTRWVRTWHSCSSDRFRTNGRSEMQVTRKTFPSCMCCLSAAETWYFGRRKVKSKLDLRALPACSPASTGEKMRKIEWTCAEFMRTFSYVFFLVIFLRFLATFSFSYGFVRCRTWDLLRSCGVALCRSGSHSHFFGACVGKRRHQWQQGCEWSSSNALW